MVNDTLTKRKKIIKNLFAIVGSENGDEEALRQCIQKGEGIYFNHVDDHGDSLLYKAVLNGHEACVKLILEQRKSLVRIKNKEGNYPVHAAAAEGYVQLLKSLLETDANLINVVNAQKSTLFHVASAAGQGEVIEFLCDYWAEQSNTNRGMKPLEVALEAVDAQGNTPLHLAAKHGHKEIVEDLLDEEVQIDSVNKEKYRPLMCAVEAGHHELVLLLLDEETRSNENSVIENIDVCLSIASREGYINIVETLLKKGVPMDKKDPQGRAPLHEAAANGHIEILKILLKHNINLEEKTEKKENTALGLACRHGHISTVALLLNEGANINVKNKVQNTPLILAVVNNHSELVRFILSKYPALLYTTIDENKNNLLHIASEKGAFEVVEQLINLDQEVASNKRLVHAENIHQETPLHIAAEYNHVDVLYKLLEKSPQLLNQRNKWGDTALHVAIQEKAIAATHLLVYQGADLAVQNAENERPLELLLNQEDPLFEVIPLLLGFANKEQDTVNCSERFQLIKEEDKRLLGALNQEDKLKIKEFIIEYLQYRNQRDHWRTVFQENKPMSLNEQALFSQERMIDLLLRMPKSEQACLRVFSSGTINDMPILTSQQLLNNQPHSPILSWAKRSTKKIRKKNPESFAALSDEGIVALLIASKQARTSLADLPLEIWHKIIYIPNQREGTE